MSNPKRRYRGNDRATQFFARQRELDEAEFAAIAERYRKEIIQLGDGTKATVFGEAPRERPAPALKPLARTNARSGDALLELAINHQAHIVEGSNAARAADAECKQALRDRGVSFQREPKSIHSKVPQGRIGSIPKPKAPPKKPDGNGGKVSLWKGNEGGNLPRYIHRHYGQGDL